MPESDEIKWPGDLLTTFRASLVTHEMLEIKPADQIGLVARKRRGGSEGREAEIQLELCRIAIIKWLGECDLCEVLEPVPPGEGMQGGKMRRTGRFRSRWIGDYIRGNSGVQYGNWADGTPDDYFRLITDNFDEFFQKIEFFDFNRMALDPAAKLGLRGLGLDASDHAQTLKYNPKYEENLRWFSSNMPRFRREAVAKFADEPKRPRVEPKQSIAALAADDEDVQVETKPRGRPVGSKDKAKRTEKGFAKFKKHLKIVDVRKRELEDAGVIARATGVVDESEDAEEKESE